MSGPPERWMYCPWWVPAFWRTRENKGCYPVHFYWGMVDEDVYQGLGRVIMGMTSALASAECEAQKQYQTFCNRPKS